MRLICKTRKVSTLHNSNNKTVETCGFHLKDEDDVSSSIFNEDESNLKNSEAPVEVQ